MPTMLIFSKIIYEKSVLPPDLTISPAYWGNGQITNGSYSIKQGRKDKRVKYLITFRFRCTFHLLEVNLFRLFVGKGNLQLKYCVHRRFMALN